MTVTNAQPRPHGATLEEVAKVAGVSRATVSRVVNGSPRVSGDVRRSVQTAIDHLGYIPNRAARSLVTRRSYSIAVVITEPAGRLFTAGDPTALAEAVVQTLTSPAHGQAAASRAIARRYDWLRVGAAVTHVYEATLAATDPATDLRGVS